MQTACHPRRCLCRDVLAVFPLTPTPTRQGGLIFLDPRQVNSPPTFMYVEGHRIFPADIVRYLGVRRPPMHHFSFRPTVVVGFRADADSSEDDAETEDQNLDEDSDDTDDPEGGLATTSVADDVEGTGGRAAADLDMTRSRSPTPAVEPDRAAPLQPGRALRNDAHPLLHLPGPSMITESPLEPSCQ